MHVQGCKEKSYPEIHLSLRTSHWCTYSTLGRQKNCIYVIEAKIVTPRVEHIDTPIYFLQYQFDNGIFIPKYEKSSVMPADICTKPCSGPIFIRSTKWMNGFRFYPIIETEHYQLMRLHELVVK